MATMSKLQRLLHPHRAHDQDELLRSGNTSPTTLASPSDLSSADEKTLKDAYGGTCSSMEMFAMFKAMASSRLPGVKKAQKGGKVELGPDEGDDTDETETPQAMTPPDPESVQLGGEDADPGVDFGEPVDKQMLASRLAALSLSNLSPLTQQNPDHPHHPHHRKRPELPRYNSNKSVKDTQEPAEKVSAVSPLQTMQEIPAASSPTIESPITSDGESEERSGADDGEDATDEEKMKAIIEDFGEIAELQQPTEDNDGAWESERLLAESTGSLFRGVMLIGNLHLTTHRLLFHALLPPLATSIARGEPGDGTSSRERAVDSAMAQFTVLHSGAVNVHRPGRLASKRRLWMELSAEMITAYPSADEAGRVRPIRTTLLSSIRHIEPIDPSHPHEIVITHKDADGETRSIKYSVDTPESALTWRREIEGALFRHARARWARRRKANAHPEDPNAQRGDLSEHAPGEGEDGQDDWSMLRVCIPLDRVRLLACEDYHGFARLLNIDVNLDSGQSPMSLPFNSLPVRAVKGITPATEAEPVIERAATSPALGAAIGDATRPDIQPTGKPIKSSLSLRKTITAITHPRSPTREASTVSAPVLISSPLGQDQDSSECFLNRPTWAWDSAKAGVQPFAEEEHSNSCNMRIGLLNQHEWFAKAFNAALHASHGRRYKDGVERPKVIIKVGDHDCLAADDEEEEQSRDSDQAHEDPEDSNQGLSRAKAEKAAMAAKVFGLDPDEEIWLKRCYLGAGVVPIRGHIIISSKYICFWRRNKAATDVKYRFPLYEVKGAVESGSARIGMHGMDLQIEGHHDLRFEFWNVQARRDTMTRIQLAVASVASRGSDAVGTPELSSNDEPRSDLAPIVESPSSIARSDQSGPRLGGEDRRQKSVLAPKPETFQKPMAVPDHAINFIPYIANRVSSGMSVVKPRHFVCLTIGSRGDVQPYIALGLGLMKDGHRVTIVTHGEFKKWIEGYGIAHREAGGDPTALMKLSADHKMFSVGFFQESIGYFRQWLDDLLVDSWHACHDADVLIESPSTMSGVHIAEALKIPYFRAFTMPWTRTSAYPQAFMVPAVEMGPGFNYSTYVLYDNIIWTATAPQINPWRKKHLKLKATDMAHLSVKKIPFLYNFSSAVVPKPLDWHDDITITGYWNLENSDTEWTPPESLDTFIKTARERSKPLVYIGFGSIVVNHADQMTKSIIKAVAKADVYAVIAKGWSSRGADPAKEGDEIEYPDNCYPIEKVPHGWLFPQIDAAMHHGGAGTVGASLRAGLPTMIKPFFGDQFFWANRVTRLEAGVRVNSLGSDDLASALTKATQSTVMIEKARRIGEKIRAEDGVTNAKRAIYSQLTRAKADRTKMHWAHV